VRAVLADLTDLPERNTPTPNARAAVSVPTALQNIIAGATKRGASCALLFFSRFAV
jgi:hypothetical protein